MFTNKTKLKLRSRMEENANSVPKNKVKVLLAEDHKLTAKLLTEIINRSGNTEVVGVASDGREVITMARDLEPDVILMDINLPFIDGISAMESIFGFNHKVKVIVCSSYDEAWIIKKSINEGASGFITKKAKLDCIVDAIMTVSRGGAYLDELCLDILMNKVDNKTESAAG